MSTTWQFWIDVGGTFTDCLARGPGGEVRENKVLSSASIKCGVEAATGTSLDATGLEGFPPQFFAGYDVRAGTCGRTSRVVNSAGGSLELAEPLLGVSAGGVVGLSCGEPAPVLAVRTALGLGLDQEIGRVEVRLGTTRGTNALLERRGAATCLVTTRGFADVLEIGDQSRPRLFELDIRKPEALYGWRVEIEERLAADGTRLLAPDSAAVRRALEPVLAEGAEAVAICFVNAYRNGCNEGEVAEIARELGFSQVSISSEVSPTIKMIPRGDTTVVDAYLTPVLQGYLAEIHRAMPEAKMTVMSSAGGLMELGAVSGKDTVLSGPAGGVVGLSHVARSAGLARAIGFDMGGTSTDVSRWDGQLSYEYETEKAGVRIVAPMLAVETVAAGGGSICGFDGQKLIVGPRSAGAQPGPVCYGRGGPLALTDANLVLGRVVPSAFPFPLDVNRVRVALAGLRDEVVTASGTEMSEEELAEGFIRIANAKMAAAIRRISVARGVDVREFALVSFGGAGGQHACAVARELGVRDVVVHPYAGVLSAFGMGAADVRRFAVRTVMEPLDAPTLAGLQPKIDELARSLSREVAAAGVPSDRVRSPVLMLELRYAGQASAIEVSYPEAGGWRREFERRHAELYGHVFAGRAVEIAALRVEVVGEMAKVEMPTLPRHHGEVPTRGDREVFSGGGWQRAPVVQRADLGAGAELVGPAIVVERSGTTLIEAGWICQVSEIGDLRLSDRAPSDRPSQDEQVNPVDLEVYNNHFAAIAEEMGTTLRRTALSVNVKERLDFSCAVFDGGGSLVANAPHMPVHLGAMSETIRCVIEDRPELRAGDVVVTNDPFRGGSHLPDITVVTPVFESGRDKPVFYTASRAHHAEIGGIRPGSMPPDSTCLAEEGVLLRSFVAVRAGETRFDELRAMLSSGRYPSRSPDENIADIGAQIAANQLGVHRLHALMGRAGRDTTLSYMGHIQDAAAARMRASLASIADGEYHFRDQLDNGATIAVEVSIRGEQARIDFEGTGPQLGDNLNANLAIVKAAVIYCFRCLIDAEIPLNEGVLEPLEIVVPRSLLRPHFDPDPQRCPAVVGGNVETSQRVTDVILGALGLAAASQGTMNNFCFGDGSFGYYETICGGAGAGPDFAGASAVHTHMTNTRLTDPEILEAQTPVRIRRFEVRRGSGGEGAHRGGDGCTRELEFLSSLEVSLLSQRRSTRPFGLAGGKPGAPGRNRLLGADGSERELSGVVSLTVQPGDRIRIDTPGGGGFGEA
ncbi:MAG: hydantoinase B/oxoprolinase family protein [Acidobacteriota bacterium]|nr:hydantoinase B/oxoprolinase family protein [Acidobacteriota bacterium]